MRKSSKFQGNRAETDRYYICTVSFTCCSHSAVSFLCRFRKINHTRAHSYWACLCHLIFTVISGWCWKHSVTDLELRLDQVSPGAPGFVLATGLYVYLTLHGALGILRFGHPQLCMNRGFRKIYEISFMLLRVVPGILITAQIYGFYWARMESGELLELRKGVIGGLLFTYNLSYIILGSIGVAVLNELYQSFDYVKLVIIVGGIVLLTLIGSLDEAYWTVFLGVQVVVCNFGLEIASSRYEISFLEMFMIGMSFFNIFAYRSLGELIEVLMDSIANQS